MFGTILLFMKFAQARPSYTVDKGIKLRYKPISIILLVNKYAIYAYTHGPVTGSGPSVKPLKYDVAPYWLS